MKLGLMALSALLFSATLPAQDLNYAGYPVERVRTLRDESHVPDRYYPENRLILRNVRMVNAGAGMKITGDVFSDFEADRVPPSEESIQRGQQPVMVDVQLVQFTTLLKRTAGIVNDPQIALTQNVVRTPVPNQNVSFAVKGTMGFLGHQPFELPTMDKPLAPGIYGLIATAKFESQPAAVRNAIKWCSDWFGHIFNGTVADQTVKTHDRDGDKKLTREEAPDKVRAAFARYDTDGDGKVTREDLEREDEAERQAIYQAVMSDPDLHQQTYRDLLGLVQQAESVCMMYVGQTLQNGAVTLTPPGQRNANYMLWTPHHVSAQEAADWKLQLDTVDELVERQLNERLNADTGSPPRGVSEEEWKAQWEERYARWKADAEAEKIRIRKNNTDLLRRRGGPPTPAESAMLTAAQAARPAVLEQIARFEEGLAYQYWVLTSGHIEYGYHTLNVPGYNAWEAVNSDDLTKDKRERIAKYGEVDRREWEQKLRDDWKRVPKDITDIAAQYLKRRMFSADFDAEKFCEKGSGTEILLDIGKWAAFRAEFRQKFLEETNKVLEKVTTTNRYANQVWPLVLAQATTARDSVITVGYAWEYYIRRNGMEHDAQSIRDGWQAEAARETNLRLETYYQRAQGSPGTVDTAIKGYVEYVKRNTGVPALATAYSAAIQAGAATRDLPGRGE